MSNSVIDTSHLSLADIAWTGTNLHRPECVLATRAGDLYCADWRGGVTHIRSDGSQATHLGHEIDGEALKPNGIALRRDGSFLIAHLGAQTGGVFALERDGRVRPLLRTVEGLDLPPTNFVLPDVQGRLWITVSTRKTPRALGYRHDVADGFVVLVDARGARIVADGLGYTNECLIDRDGAFLYVNETFGRRLSRFAIRPDGSLGSRETVTRFDAGTFPDGLAQDAHGDFWITSIVSNRLIRVDRNGAQSVLLEDASPARLDAVEEALQGHHMGREHLDTVHGDMLCNISSLAFGGPDLRTGYLGCLLGDTLATVRMPVAGHPPLHWNYA